MIKTIRIMTSSRRQSHIKHNDVNKQRFYSGEICRFHVHWHLWEDEKFQTNTVKMRNQQV